MARVGEVSDFAAEGTNISGFEALEAPPPPPPPLLSPKTNKKNNFNFKISFFLFFFFKKNLPDEEVVGGGGGVGVGFTTAGVCAFSGGFARGRFSLAKVTGGTDAAEARSFDISRFFC